MKRKKNTPVRLRDMNPTRALAYCANLTSTVWSTMESGDTMELWAVFRAYILNGYNETETPVPARIGEVWNRCKLLIDREARK